MARVLIVDDHQDTRDVYAEVLKGAGHQVIEAANGPEAVALSAQQPDLVLLDLYLPGLDGFEVCRQIKRGRLTARTPVIVITAVYRGADEKAEAFAAGAGAWIGKPVDPTVLLSTVEKLLSSPE